MNFSNINIPKPSFDDQLSDVIDEEEEATQEVRAPQHAAPATPRATSIPTPPQPEPVEPAVSTTVATAPSAATSDEPKSYKVHRSDEETAALNARAAAGELLPGRKKHATYSFGWTTNNDLLLVWQIATGRYMKDTILQTSRGLKSVANIYSRLRKLQNGGLVRAVRVSGYDQLWLPTSLGHKFLEANGWGDADSFAVVGPDDIPKNLDHPLAVNLVTAQLIRGDIYNLGYRTEGAAPVPLNRLVSEWTIRSSWMKVTEPDDGQPEEIRLLKAKKLRDAVEGWVKDGRTTYQQQYAETPALWMPSTLPRKQLSDDGRQEFIVPGRSHTPDLIVNRLAHSKGLQVNTAIEVELTKKTVVEYERIFKVYLARGGMYHRVVWITADEKIDKVMQKAIENVPGAELQNVLLRLNIEGLPLLNTIDEREKHRAMQSMKRKLPKHKGGSTSVHFETVAVDDLG